MLLLVHDRVIECLLLACRLNGQFLIKQSHWKMECFKYVTQKVKDRHYWNQYNSTKFAQEITEMIWKYDTWTEDWGSFFWHPLLHAGKDFPWCWCKGGAGVVKQVKLEPYSLVSSAKRHSPNLTPWSQDLLIHKPSQLPGEHTARLPFPAHRTIQTHEPSLSYQLPTYLWVSRMHVWARCLAW